MLKKKKKKNKKVSKPSKLFFQISQTIVLKKKTNIQSLSFFLLQNPEKKSCPEKNIQAFSTFRNRSWKKQLSNEKDSEEVPGTFPEPSVKFFHKQHK